MAEISTNVALAVQLLEKGEVVAVPTETVYGLAGLTHRVDGVAKIFAAKERPKFDPLISHVAMPENATVDWIAYLADQQLIDASQIQDQRADAVQKLATKFWPGPLTMVLPKHNSVPDLATSGLPTVGVRVPAHPLTQQLLRELGQPISAPSANRFGRISPTSAADVQAELGDRIRLILDGGSCRVGLESTIVGWDWNASSDSGSPPVLLRPGGISASELSAVLGQEVTTPSRMTAATDQQIVAPGQLASHYAPATPLLAFETLDATAMEVCRKYLAKMDESQHVYALAICFGEDRWHDEVASAVGREVRGFALSRDDDLSEAARNLFAMLRSLDEDPNVGLIIAQLPTQPVGLAHAIADRLRRASAEQK